MSNNNNISSQKKKKCRSVDDDENIVNGGTYMKSNKSKSELKMEIENYMDRVMETPIPFSNTNVYDGCPEIKKKINDFLKRDGVTKASFCRVIGNVNNNSLSRFQKKRQQDGCGIVAYPLAYKFFEKMRIMENKSKTKKRLQNEADHQNGFSLTSPSIGRPPTTLNSIALSLYY